MNTKLWIPALLAATTFSAAAIAHDGTPDRDWRDGRRDNQRDERRETHMPQSPGHYYGQRPVVYSQPVAYRPAPIYHAGPPMLHDHQRVVAQTIGAVAGGVIGHQVGNGHIAPTLIGAVIGGVIGNQFAH